METSSSTLITININGTISLYLILLVIFHLSSLPSPSLGQQQQAPCDPGDKTALLQIKGALNNPDACSFWDSNTDCCANWGNTVGCDSQTGRVTYLSITSSNASGQIPPAIGQLSFLQFLNLLENANLTGSIPDTFGKLTALITLDLSANGLSGRIPSFIGRFLNLTSMDLSGNMFTGSIPSSFSKPPNLAELSLTDNKLTGHIPSSLGNMAANNLQLSLDGNFLTGPIPKSFTKLKLEVFSVADNQLCGPIPQGGKLQSFGTAPYDGNKCLCGAPLTNPCPCPPPNDHDSEIN